MGEYRTATVADIMKRMQEEPRYERYSVADMGWGMGNAQNGIEAAVRGAEKLGLVTVEKNHADWKLMASLTEAGKAWGTSREPRLGDDAYVTLTDGAVEKWNVTSVYGDAYDEAEACQADPYQVGVFGRDADGVWRMHTRGTVMFISPTEDEDEPEFDTGKGPHTGDLTTRVINGASLLYRVRRVETHPIYRTAILALVGEAPDHPITDEVYRPRGEGWQWQDGEPVTFTSGRANEMAWKASRLDTLHRKLRAQYFHYEALLHAPEVRDGKHGSSLMTYATLRDEFAVSLFLAETGLLPDQAQEGHFDNFYEALHDEYMATRED